MIYEFSHYPTDAGRRVRFVMSRDDLHRVQAAGFWGAAMNGHAEIISTEAVNDVMVVMTPGAARLLVDALGMVGGDAVVAARMLSAALDGMVQELRTARAILDLTGGPRRDSRRKPAARA